MSTKIRYYGHPGIFGVGAGLGAAVHVQGFGPGAVKVPDVIMVPLEFLTS